MTHSEDLVRFAYSLVFSSPLITLQVIHGAVSYDEGSTWHGFRELYRDPYMDVPYEYGHDSGTAYATGKEMENGNVVASAGQVKKFISPNTTESPGISHSSSSSLLEQRELFARPSLSLILVGSLKRRSTRRSTTSSSSTTRRITTEVISRRTASRASLAF